MKNTSEPRRAVWATAILLLAALAVASAFAEELSQDSLVDLSFPDRVSVHEAYRAVAEASGVRILFDPKLRDVRTSIELESVTARKALDLLAMSTGQFVTPVDENTVLIADDTPQNRRTYEKQVIRTFHLENMKLADAMTIGRSLLGLKNVAVSEDLNGMVIRDTASKVAVAERLFSSLDQPRGEVTVDVNLLYVDSRTLESLTGGSSSNPLDPASFADLSRNAQRLTSQELSMLDRDRGMWTLRDDFRMKATATSVADLELGFELLVEPKVHASDEVTLEVSLTLSDAAENEKTLGPVASTRKVESGVRLRSGETFLLTGLEVGSGKADGQSLLASRFDLAGGPGEVVLALTPRVVRGPGFTESDLAAICVGTEAHIELCDGGTLTRTAAASE